MAKIMNERIRELAEQAHLSWCLENDWDQENLQEFAELIVEECVKFVPSATQSNAILKHFGVERG